MTSVAFLRRAILLNFAPDRTRTRLPDNKAKHTTVERARFWSAINITFLISRGSLFLTIWVAPCRIRGPDMYPSAFSRAFWSEASWRNPNGKCLLGITGASVHHLIRYANGILEKSSSYFYSAHRPASADQVIKTFHPDHLIVRLPYVSPDDLEHINRSSHYYCRPSFLHLCVK